MHTTRGLSAAIAILSLCRQPAAAQSVVRAEPVVVSETPLRADADGTSHVQVSDVAPLAGRGLSGIAENVANLNLSASGAGSFGSMLSLRGLSNTPYFSDPSVAVYFDDLPLGSSFTYPVDLFGFGSATVMRGPQPAAAGRSAEGGLVIFSSVLPANVAAGAVRVAFGNHDSRRAAIEARSARHEKADVSISAAYHERDGYIENTELNTTVDDQQSSSLAARLRLRPNARTEISLQLLANQRRDGAQPLVPADGPHFQVARGREGRTDSDFLGAALKFAFETAFGTLTATTSHTDWQLDPYENRLVFPPPLDSRLTQSQRAWNQELRLASATSSSGTAWHIGAWFSDTRTDGGVNRSIPGLFPIEASAFTLDTRTAAVFGQASVPLVPGWQLIPAVRLEQVERDFDRTQTVPAPDHYTSARTFRSAQPKLTTRHALSADAHVTASVGYATKPGGWSAYTDNPQLARFNAEKTLAFEVGADTWLANGTLNLAVRAFDYEIDDFHVERSFNATDYLVVNAPEARSVGTEFEAAWRPTRQLTITGTLGLTDTTLRRFTDPFTGARYDGRRAPYSPNYDAHVGVLYRSQQGWFVGADATAVGRTYFEESESAASSADARVTGNAQAGYETGRWRVTAFGQNLADVRYRALVVAGIGHMVPGAPRTYGLELTARW